MLCVIIIKGYILLCCQSFSPVTHVYYASPSQSLWDHMQTICTCMQTFFSFLSPLTIIAVVSDVNLNVCVCVCVCGRGGHHLGLCMCSMYPCVYACAHVPVVSTWVCVELNVHPVVVVVVFFCVCDIF